MNGKTVSRKPRTSKAKASSANEKEFLNQPYARILVPEDDGTYSAEVLEFAGCFAQGDTAEEALSNLNDAALGWMNSVTDKGDAIPRPAVTRGYSGFVTLRLPKGVHSRAVKIAERNGTSLNQFLVSAVSSAIGAHELYRDLSERITEIIGQMRVLVDARKIELTAWNVTNTFNASHLGPARSYKFPFGEMLSLRTAVSAPRATLTIGNHENGVVTEIDNG